jgi:TfoX/Sxy family transcriptional regulator of competence genes
MAYDEMLAGRVAAYLAAKNLPVEEKRMMGGLCFMVRGKMCAGVEKDRLMVRTGPDAYDAALRRPGCKPMDFTGRPMRGFVFVQRTGLRTTRQLAAWLDLALAYNPQAAAAKKRR